MNLYAYVGNDPINLVDPTGKAAGPSFQSIGDMLAKMFYLRDASHGNAVVARKIVGFNNSIESITPSRGTTHKVGSGASFVLTIGALTPCSLGCLKAAAIIDAALAADLTVQGKYGEAVLTLVPTGAGNLASLTSKTVKEATQRSVATGILTQQSISHTTESSGNQSSDSQRNSLFDFLSTDRYCSFCDERRRMRDPARP